MCSLRLLLPVTLLLITRAAIAVTSASPISRLLAVSTVDCSMGCPHRSLVAMQVAVINMTRGLLTHAAAVDACTAQRCLGITSCNISPASMPAGLVSSGDPCCSCWDSTGSVLYTRGDTVVQSNGEPWAVPALAAVDLSASSSTESPYRCSPEDGGWSAILGALGPRGGDASRMSKLVEMRHRHTSLLPVPKLVTAVCRDAATGAMLVGFGGSGGVVYVN